MSRPNINIPTEFAVNGIKTPFSNEKIEDGFDRINPDVFAGDNLNKFIDDTYKGLNGVLELYEGCVLYDSTVTYTNKSLVFDITNDGIKFYHSLQNGNINHALTDADYWEEVNLGGADVDLTNLTNQGTVAIAHNAMPSNTYIDLTLGASGATYTAPADGYVLFQHYSTATGQLIAIRSQVSGSNTQATVLQRICASGSGQHLALTLPVCKNQIYSISYTCNGTSGIFLRFVYAQGSESEA